MLGKEVWQKRWKEAELFSFDLDGTLLDTIGDLWAATNHALETLGYPLRSRDEIRSFVGNGNVKTLERAFPDDLDLTDEILDDLLKHFYEYYYEHLWVYSEPYEGIVEVLEELQAKDKKLIVLTNKEQTAAESLIEHFFPGVFLEVAGQAEGRILKPNPEYFLGMIERNGGTPNNTIHIGDADTDMLVAHNAKVTGAGATWGFRDAEVLVENKASGLLEQARDILDLI